MIRLIKVPFCMLLLLWSGALQEVWGQALAPVEQPWFVGVHGGTSFGQGSFRSITEHQIHWGLQGGPFGGYRFNRLFSLEAGVQFGQQDQSALDCCPYWMSADGVRYMSPVPGEQGWFYKDLQTTTQWTKCSLQANIDLLSLVTRPGNPWSLTVSPQVSAVTTQTRWVTPDTVIDQDRLWHLGLGGQASVGVQVCPCFTLSLYGAITCLTGKRFDRIPVHGHKSNLLWDTGIMLTFPIK